MLEGRIPRMADVNKKGFIVYVFFLSPHTEGWKKDWMVELLKRFAVDGSAKSSRL